MKRIGIVLLALVALAALGGAVIAVGGDLRDKPVKEAEAFLGAVKDRDFKKADGELAGKKSKTYRLDDGSEVAFTPGLTTAEFDVFKVDAVDGPHGDEPVTYTLSGTFRLKRSHLQEGEDPAYLELDTLFLTVAETDDGVRHAYLSTGP